MQFWHYILKKSFYSNIKEIDFSILQAKIRPGEKLYEELLAESQWAANQVFEKIFIGNSPHYVIEETLAFVESLENKTDQEIREEIVAFANTHQ